MQIQNLLQSKFKNLLQSKLGRIKLAGGAAAIVLVFIIVLVMLFSGGESEPPPAPVQQAAPVEKPLPPAPPNASNSQVILELFNPTDQSLTHQITNTTISQQIEQTLTVTYVLTKCLIISQDDYRDIFRALIMYAQMSKLSPDAASAETQVRQIAESANASYSLIYSRTSCRDPQLPPLAKQVTQWTQTMFRQEQ